MPELFVPIRTRGALVKVLVRRPGGVPSQPLTAYLDTGASDTMLDEGIVASLGLEADRCIALNVLGRDDPSFHATHAVEMALVTDGVPPVWVQLAVLGGPVFPTGAVVALGRDFLSRVVMTYDGPARQVRLRW
jgi:hypothetical protein